MKPVMFQPGKPATNYCPHLNSVANEWIPQGFVKRFTLCRPFYCAAVIGEGIQNSGLTVIDIKTSV